MIDPVHYSITVGRTIAMRREHIGMSQGALAKAVGLDQSTWCRIEHGKSALTIVQLAKAVDALGTTPESLLRSARLTMNSRKGRV